MADPTPWYDDLQPPAWFDDRVHRAGDGGVYEIATGVLLDADGVPVSGPVRAERAASPAAHATPAAPIQE